MNAIEQAMREQLRRELEGREAWARVMARDYLPLGLGWLVNYPKALGLFYRMRPRCRPEWLEVRP
jgi:hypothetical protein